MDCGRTRWLASFASFYVKLGMVYFFFNGIISSPTVIVTLIGSDVSPDPMSSLWVPPCLGFLKINCNGAFSPSIFIGVASFVIRDEFGELSTRTYAFGFSCIRTGLADIQTFKSAILYACYSIHHSFIVESDWQLLVLYRASNSNWDNADQILILSLWLIMSCFYLLRDRLILYLIK